MRDVKKVLKMRSQNYSQRQISVSLKISSEYSMVAEPLNP